MSYNFATLSNQLVVNIQQISTNVKSLQKLVTQLGTQEDTTLYRQQLQTLQHQTNELAKQCGHDMRQLTMQCHTTDANQNKENKIICERIRSDFFSILNKFQEIQKIAAHNVKQFNVQPVKHDINLNGNPFYANEDFNFESTTLSFKDEHLGQTQTQMTELETERTRLELAQQQHEAVVRLETDIQDVNQIFQDLAKMVYEQQDIVDHIETNVISAQIRVEDGHQQLRTAAEYQKKARKKRLCIVIVFAIILFILTLIIYFSVHH